MSLPKFKSPELEAQYLSRSPILQKICAEFCALSRELGIEPVVTRVLGRVQKESGVHPAGRAVDFRDDCQGADGKVRSLYGDDQAKSIVDRLNARYPRTDGKQVALHHKVDGSEYHFHIQVPPKEGIIHEKQSI